MEITQEQFYNAKENALKYFKAHKKITSPILWDVKITFQWIEHIEYKTKNKKRPLNEAYIRYLCFLNIAEIIENWYSFQEYRREIKKIWVKWNKKRYFVEQIVEYFWIITNIQNREMKVVIRKISWRTFAEFVSIIPTWKK